MTPYDPLWTKPNVEPITLPFIPGVTCRFPTRKWDAEQNKSVEDPPRIFIKPGMGWSKDCDDKLVAMYMEGVSFFDISQRLGRSGIACEKRMATLRLSRPEIANYYRPRPVQPVRAKSEALPPPVKPSVMPPLSPDIPSSVFAPQVWPDNVKLCVIRNAVCIAAKVGLSEFCSPQRFSELVKARQVYFWIARRISGKSYRQIANFAGKRDHTTIQHGIRLVEKEFPRFSDLVQSAQDEIIKAQSMRERG